MSEWRAEILRKRLGNILKEWEHADEPKRTELLAEAMLIWRDLQAAERTPLVPLRIAN